MNFKSIILILSLASSLTHAQTNNEVSDGTGKAQNRPNGSLEIGDSIWVNNLCKLITSSGELELVSPIGKAITTCPRKIDYGQIEVAYAKLSEPVKLQSCLSIDLKQSEVGESCLTSQGIEFKRVSINGKLGLQDMGAKGLVWFDEITSNVNQYDAEKVCKENKGQTLPTSSDFQTAEDHGFREAFSADMDAKYFWSSTVQSDDGDVAYILDGSSGYIDYVDRDFRSSKVSSRCVGAAGVVR